ncbi:MAG TPA: hypothetical protein VMZ29_08490 [Candidatus Bathyarchaeia archaeon]|nr:hypothetical protein [Candidatus Bathyarchaeia archaeon]
MAVIKISDKKALDELQARLILQLGRKITLQEIIDLCVEFASSNFEEIVAKAANTPRLTKDRAQKIIKNLEQLKGTPYDPKAKLPTKDDEEIYSL